MEQYRKLDQYYIDEYDRVTIRELKNLEKTGDDYPSVVKHFGKSTIDKYNPASKLYTAAVIRAQDREKVIKARQEADERKDNLVQRFQAPKNISCNTCNSPMFLCTHVFEENDTRILFAFECSNGHAPRKLIYPDGREKFFPKRRCDSCDYEIRTKSKKKGRKYIITDTCTGCGKATTDELELPPKPEPITETERKKYCLDFIGKETFIQALERIEVLSKHIKLQDEEKLLKEESGIDKVERVNVPQMEDRLAKLCEEISYTKFKFDTPASGRFLTVRFSAQDPSNRTEQESIKKLTKTIKGCVFATNWRLVTTGITYQLGFLMGQLKAYTGDEDIMRIGREIKEKEAKKLT